MRALILIAGASLAISACDNNEATDNTANVAGDLTAENIVANDTTSIDAVTAEDANMAAETAITANDIANDTGNDAGNTSDGATNNAT